MSHNSIRRSVIIQPFLQERKWLEIELIITYAFCPLAVFTGSNCSGLRWCSKLLHYFFKGGVGQTFKRPLSRFGIILSLLSFCHFFAKTFKPSLCCLRLLSDWTLSFDLPTLQPFDGVIVILELTYSSLAACVMIFRPRLSSRGGRNKSQFFWEKRTKLKNLNFCFKYLFEIKHLQYVSYNISKNYVPNNFLWA